MKWSVKEIAIIESPQFEGVPPHWMPYVWVDDVHETAAKAQGLGATLLMPVMDVPGIGEMATLRDPTGAVFSIYHAPRPKEPVHVRCRCRGRK